MTMALKNRFTIVVSVINARINFKYIVKYVDHVSMKNIFAKKINLKGNVLCAIEICFTYKKQYFIEIHVSIICAICAS